MVEYLVDRLNAAKCYPLKITRQCKFFPTKYNINSILLQEVSHHPYFGVKLSSNLTWKYQSVTSQVKFKEYLTFSDGIYMAKPGHKRKSFHSTCLALSKIFIISLGWSGGAMVLGKLPVPERPTIWMTVGQRPIALAVDAGGGLFGHFYSSLSFLSSFSHSLGDGPI